MVRRAFDLNVAAGPEVDDLALGQLEHEFLDEGRDVVVGPHGTGPLTDAEHGLRDTDAQVVRDGDLTRESLAGRRLAFRDM